MRSSDTRHITSHHEKMSSKYVLHYFPLPGRAEVARLLFHLAEVEFTDRIVPFAEWSALKSDAKLFPLGQVPTLEVDGEVLCQSRAIDRYIAEKFNLHGSSDKERKLIDQVCETLLGINEAIYTIKFKDKTKSKEEKVAAINEYLNSARFKMHMHFLTSKIQGTFFLDGKACVADATYFTTHDFLENCGVSMDQYPKLNALKSAFVEIPSIKKYLATRQVGW